MASERGHVLEVQRLQLLRSVLAHVVVANGAGVPRSERFEIGEDGGGDGGIVRWDDLDGVGPVDFVAVVVLESRTEVSEDWIEREDEKKPEPSDCDLR